MGMQVPLVDVRAQYEDIRANILSEMSTTLERLGLATDHHVRAFEGEFAAYCQARYALGVASGMDAMYFALRACGVRAGDEVITVANGFVRTTASIALLGATPVFVDVDPATYTMDASLLEAAIGPLTRVIVPVHLYGQMADMTGITAIRSEEHTSELQSPC